MISLLYLFWTFFKIGIVSFGGGYAMIPLLTDEVLANGWLTEEQIMNFIAVSESTPGPIAVNMATFIGSAQGDVILGGVLGRIIGAFFATLGVVLPSFIIILLIASIMVGLLKFAGVKAFLSGLRPVVVGLIISTGLIMSITVLLGITNVYLPVAFDWRALVIFATIAIIYYFCKYSLKKEISPIILILISAIFGIIFYGFLGGF
ncbi:MAG: chromate transporter [Clostridia bacterium]|nr:chromate transporter [Clostridia bacterium]